MTVKETVEGLNELRALVRSAMKQGHDFGVIPGTGGKPTLFLPGAQKVALYFNAAPTYTVIDKELSDGHVEYRVTAQLVHRGSGHVIGEGLGLCSTMESKYRFRKAERVCPECGKSAIIKGKQEYGGGWLCFKKKGGCGAKFPDNAPAITEQADGQTENANIHDTRNTVLKIAKKRAVVDAAMSLGCMAELFTQDIGDIEDPGSDAGYSEEDQGQQEPPKATKPEQPKQSTNGAAKPAGPVTYQNGNVQKLSPEAEAALKPVMAKFFEWLKGCPHRIDRKEFFSQVQEAVKPLGIPDEQRRRWVWAPLMAAYYHRAVELCLTVEGGDALLKEIEDPEIVKFMTFAAHADLKNALLIQQNTIKDRIEKEVGQYR